MKVLATRKDESLFQGLSRTEEISPGNFGFYATWIALAVILSVFVISALYISHIYRTNERNDIAQSAELLAETVDARLSTTSEAVSRYSHHYFLPEPFSADSFRFPPAYQCRPGLEP